MYLQNYDRNWIILISVEFMFAAFPIVELSDGVFYLFEAQNLNFIKYLKCKT